MWQRRSAVYLCLLGVGTPKDPMCHVIGTGQMTGRLFPAVQSVATVQPAAVVVELTWLKTTWMCLFQKTVSSSAWTYRWYFFWKAYTLPVICPFFSLFIIFMVNKNPRYHQKLLRFLFNILKRLCSIGKIVKFTAWTCPYIWSSFQIILFT